MPLLEIKKHWTFLSILLTLIGSSFAIAQSTDNKKEKIQTMKIAFITERLNLTPEEAQVFWPIYNQYQSKLDELRNTHRRELSKGRENFETLSNKEVEQLIDSEIIFKQRELDIQKEFHTKIKTTLPIKKVAKLYSAEEQFKLYLIKELKDKKL